MKQMSIILGNSSGEDSIPSHGYSAMIGIFLVGMGTLLVLFAFVRYRKVERQIDSGTFQPTLFLDILLTILVLAVGIFLVTYLFYSI